MQIKRLYLTIALILSFCVGMGVGFVVFHKTVVTIPAPGSNEEYFSPDGNVGNHIIKAIDKTKTSIDLAIFDLTYQDIGSALERAKKRGVKIRIIADSRQIKGAHSIVQSLIDEGFDIKIRHGKGRGIMHNKFAIFDKTLLVTGSYNWTYSAEHYNYENAIFLSDANTIEQYQKEFNDIWIGR